MIFLIDASSLITANRDPYPVEMFPHYWLWFYSQAWQGKVKIVREIMEELMPNDKKSKTISGLQKWLLSKDKTPGDFASLRTLPKEILLLNEEIEKESLRKVLDQGYAPDLTDTEFVNIGADAELVAYALQGQGRTIVTAEVSAPSKKRGNRKIPDVCRDLNIPCINLYEMNRKLQFSTFWVPPSEIFVDES